MSKPGTMMYWEMFDMLDKLKPEKAQTLLRAIRRYSQYGEIPDFAGNETLDVIWPMLEQKLSADNGRYERRQKQTVHAANVRWGHAHACDSMQTHTDAYERIQKMPTSSAAPTASTSPATAETATDSTEASHSMQLSPRKQNRFVPPTADEVQAYCAERGNHVDAQRFIDHYTANGWMVGRNKMKDWKATIRTWEKDGTQKSQPQYLQRNSRSRIKSEEEHAQGGHPSGFGW